MKNLNITVSNKVATYHQRDGFIVCGNSDYQIFFAFDSEWESYLAREKTARFKWNGGFKDVPFWGTTVAVPIIENATQVEVGVYVGDLSTTTPAVIPCSKSILCGSESEYIPHDEARTLDERVTEAKTALSNIAQNFTFTKTNNLFNPDAVLRGNLDKEGFTASDTGRHFCTDFIKVQPYGIVTASASLDGVREYAGVLYQYTSDKTYIKSLGFSPNFKTMTLTETTEYIRYKVDIDYTDVCLRHQIDPNLTYEPYYDGERLMPKGFVASNSAGLDAYQLAVVNGFEGTLEEWFESFRGYRGNPGESAYEIAVSKGFKGTQTEWLASLKAQAKTEPKEHHITIRKDPFDGSGSDASFEASLLLYFKDQEFPVDNRIDKIADCLKYAKFRYFFAFDAYEGRRIPNYMKYDAADGMVKVFYYEFSSTGEVSDGVYNVMPSYVIVTDEVKEMRWYDGI